MGIDELNNITTNSIKSLKNDLLKIVTSNYDIQQLNTAKLIAELLYYLKKLDIDIEGKDEIEDELIGAHKYFNEYMKTGDRDYLQMSKDELSHARKFILMRKPAARGAELKHIEDMLKLHDELQSKINSKMEMN